MLTTRRAFTLLELLIVIGVIAILVGLALAIGRSVSGRGKEVRTQELIKVLDTTIADFTASAGGGLPPATVVDPRRTNPLVSGEPSVVQPVADAYASAGGSEGLLNSVGLYLTQCEARPSTRALVQGIDAKFMRELDPDGTQETWDLLPPLRTVFDGWDRPIRYVHPAWDGLLEDNGAPMPAPSPPSGKNWFAPNLTLTRVSPHADGGLCRGGQPYFYSAGPDGDPSTTADNVYTTKPEIEKN